MPPVRYIVSCPHCGARTGTNPIGLGPGDGTEEQIDVVRCCQCGYKVSRTGGEYIRGIDTAHENEYDLLAVE